MIKLLIYSPKPVELNATSFGGKPVKNISENFSWPKCACCELPMQFLGKIKVEDDIHQIFMCQNDPGVCDDGEPDDGGNAVIVIKPNELEYVTIPAEGETLRKTEYSAVIIEVDAPNYAEAVDVWGESNNQEYRRVLGQTSGEPYWLQGDDTPNCDTCHKPMTFITQLEQGPKYETEMNFAGGSGYSFACSCNRSAKFLWQC
ncbi:hypothetical protein [Pseudoalteromonas sp. SG45-1]|uniref:hypothetical protein n=1 Tax=Pseudoalteromonas sp. SG45-1 TaxID=2760957 RepID=UPI001603D74C|nr:hypothetical protein [Pseudoalteromonas sp. SG45-1]MBB1403890.1 hypothetical protein [Pseudoalteromonas sp. SG45-1]